MFRDVKIRYADKGCISIDDLALASLPNLNSLELKDGRFMHRNFIISLSR